jgi:hypothetical protein
MFIIVGGYEEEMGPDIQAGWKKWGRRVQEEIAGAMATERLLCILGL